MDIYEIKIGDTITPEMGLELCKHFGFDYLVERLESNLDKYKSFEFDGASMLPDTLTAFLVGIKPKCFTYQCALPHDLAYAYAELGNDIEKERVDLKFKSNLITKCKMDKWKAKVFYYAVLYGGVEKLGLSFSWGFCNKHKEKNQ